MKITVLVISILLFINSENNTNFGTVKYYNEKKGFGYIIDNKLKDEIFVYEINIIDEISNNSKVYYKIRNTRKGFEAFDVRLVK